MSAAYDLLHGLKLVISTATGLGLGHWQSVWSC